MRDGPLTAFLANFFLIGFRSANINDYLYVLPCKTAAKLQQGKTISQLYISIEIARTSSNPDENTEYQNLFFKTKCFIMSAITNTNLTLTTVGSNVTVNVVYKAHFSPLERFLSSKGMKYQERIAVQGVDGVVGTVITSFP